MEAIHRYLEQIYYDPAHPASFSGIDKLYKYVKNEGRFTVSRYGIEKWLKTQETYSLHRPVSRGKKTGRSMGVSGLDSLWDIDLGVYINRFKANRGYKYIILCIDILSRYANTIAIKSKDGVSVAEGLKKIFARGRKPQSARTDQGREFTNSLVQRLFKRENIHHFTTNGINKASYAERCLRTIKSRINKYLVHNQTDKWVNILDEVTTSYNLASHRGLFGLTPGSVNGQNAPQLVKKLYMQCPPAPPELKRLRLDRGRRMPDVNVGRLKELKPKELRRKMNRHPAYSYKPGDRVRISKLRHIFVRDTNAKWTTEIFNIVRRKRIGNQQLYYLEDLMSESITGSFDVWELQRVDVGEDFPWKIEEILKTRSTRRGGKEYLILWRGWPPKFRSWIKESQLKSV